MKNEIPKIIYNLIVWGVIQMLIFGLSLALNPGLVFGLLYGLIFGLLYGLINALFGERIEYKLENIGLIKSNIFFNITIIKWMIYGLSLGLIYGLINMLNPGLNPEMINVLINGPIPALSLGLISGLISGLLGDKIKAIETLKFSYHNFKNALISGLILGLSVGLIYGLSVGLIFELSVGLSVWLISGLIFGFHGLEIENKTIPNQGIWQSAKNTVKLSALLFLPSIILVFWIRLNWIKLTIPKNNIAPQDLILMLKYGLLWGLFGGIARSGTPVIKHFTLRLVLYFNGYIPWNYARFLDYCTERMLLQRVGGRYRFIHKLLQNHFAQMEFRRD